MTSSRGSVSFLLPTSTIDKVHLVFTDAERLCIEAIEIWILAADGPEGCGWVGPDGQIVRAEEGSELIPQCPRD